MSTWPDQRHSSLKDHNLLKNLTKVYLKKINLRLKAQNVFYARGGDEFKTNLGYQKTLSQTKSTIPPPKKKPSKGRGVLENKPSGDTEVQIAPPPDLSSGSQRSVTEIPSHHQQVYFNLYYLNFLNLITHTFSKFRHKGLYSWLQDRYKMVRGKAILMAEFFK